MNFIDKKLETLFSVKGDEISEEDEGEEDNRNEKNELYMEIKNAESEKFLSHKKSKLRVKIRVIFPDKISIVHNKVADTFVETIKKIGPENVKKLGIYCAGIPIVSDKKDDLYQQRSIPPNFYVMVNSSTSDKLKQLHEINERLKLGIKIEEIIPINDH